MIEIARERRVVGVYEAVPSMGGATVVFLVFLTSIDNDCGIDVLLVTSVVAVAIATSASSPRRNAAEGKAGAAAPGPPAFRGYICGRIIGASLLTDELLCLLTYY